MFTERHSTYVVMPPAFEYLGGLFLPDLVRARLAARAARAVRVWGTRSHRVSFDPGALGFTAKETADRLEAKGVTAAAVVARAVDRTGACILEEALREAGINCGRPILSERGEDFLPPLSRRVESLARMEIPKATDRDQGGGASGVLMIIEEGEPLPAGGVVFRRVGKNLVRETEGPAGSLPAWVEEIRIVQGYEDAEATHENPENPVLLAAVLPGVDAIERDGAARWVDCFRALARTWGWMRLRLLPPNRLFRGSGRQGGAGWAARYGLDRPEVRSFLLDRVSSILPERLSMLVAVLGLFEIGSDPLEEMYAGCSLPDRNQELIENIVP